MRINSRFCFKYGRCQVFAFDPFIQKLLIVLCFLHLATRSYRCATHHIKQVFNVFIPYEAVLDKFSIGIGTFFSFCCLFRHFRFHFDVYKDITLLPPAIYWNEVDKRYRLNISAVRVSFIISSFGQ